MRLQLDGSRILVTGAASGIGRAVAVELAQEGARLALLDRDAEALAETARLVGGALALNADVTEETQVAAVASAVSEAFGRLDGLVCCAGISGPIGRGVEQTTRAEWDAVLAVNLTGPFLMVKHTLPALRAASAASVVFLSSDSATVASPGMTAYCASKGAVSQLARALAVDLADTGIRVNSVAPSIVDTPMSRRDLGVDGFDDAVHPVQTAAEVASQIVFLLSPRSRAINATAILSDFGYSALSGFPA
ncbi:SDR family NAD(P)-dependent oxidoreductase [Microbacterium arabinogalactanolyticum]|uniref:SDR family NAD(P)-dependent oxidoreductase n=1 Tax=Microbacterium arabinogalactanolyticum TaxID=69365 RepID=UPI0025534C77|nr:SDR family oxidoreductase [Microbacterium arabinogalactanolyticum]GLC85151.1 short-chain dehydrogenase [Microbacterium arabinogalactanolyticum]